MIFAVLYLSGTQLTIFPAMPVECVWKVTEKGGMKVCLFLYSKIRIFTWLINCHEHLEQWKLLSKAKYKLKSSLPLSTN